MKTIFHVDMDAFFVSVEELYNPELKGRPVVVGAPLVERNGRLTAPRGVVSAASYAARKFGVHSAMPLARAFKLCPQAIFLPVNHTRYTEMSHAIREIFGAFSPTVEMVSVDEAYIDMSGTERLWGTPLDAATRLHEEVRRRTGLPCSIGVSASRLVSKVCSDLAKPNGILMVLPGEEGKVLAPLPVRKIPGIGKATEARLRSLAIQTVADVARAGPAVLREVFGEYGEVMFRKSAGEDAGGWFEGEIGGASDPKSISHETTFDNDTAEEELIHSTLSELSQMVAHRLRAHALFARTITLKLRYSDFSTYTRAHSLAEPTDLDGEVFAAIMDLFRANWNGGKVRLLGVHAAGLERRAGQLNLLDGEQHKKWEKALEAADRVRSRFGFGSVQLGGGLKRARPGENPDD